MSALNVILVAVAFGLLVGIHEFGHFIVAKLIGVRVEIFSIGFWKKIVSWKWGETEYRLCIIPLGGYVKLAGEERPKGDEKVAEDEFFAKSPFKRILVYVAGASMNAVLGLLAFIVAFAIGVSFIVPEVGDVLPDMPAWKAGLRHGDRIVAINDRRDPDFEDVRRYAALSERGEVINLLVERDGSRFSCDLQAEYEPINGVSLLGILPPFTTRIMGVAKITTETGETSPTQEAGLKLRDEIVSVAGQPVETAYDVSYIIRRNAGKDVELEYKRGDSVRKVMIRPLPAPRYLIGVSCVSANVKSVAADGPAERAGLKEGDAVTAVNGEEVSSIIRVQEVLEDNPQAEYSIELSRNGETANIRISFADVWECREFLNSFKCAGGNVLTWVKDGSAAHVAGMRPGDRIASVAGETVATWEEFLAANGSHGAAKRIIKWERDGESLGAELAPELSLDFNEGVIGAIFQEQETRVRRYGLVDAIKVGTRKTLDSFSDLALTIRGFSTGRVSTKQMGGIIMIAAVSYKAAEIGLGRLFYLLAVISIGLAVLNLLPVPVLDGGHVAFTLVEIVRGKPVNERIMAVAQYVGLALLLALVVYVTRNDIVRLMFMFKQN